mmetsp:Transcript_40764/g.161541  ORF Transcript_40764/g.161541 Transcript_40764/m.161541 type:complete len:139 (-) Transcript_40764:218-634(-)
MFYKPTSSAAAPSHSHQKSSRSTSTSSNIPTTPGTQPSACLNKACTLEELQSVLKSRTLGRGLYVQLLVLRLSSILGFPKRQYEVLQEAGAPRKSNIKVLQYVLATQAKPANRKQRTPSLNFIGTFVPREGEAFAGTT